MLCQISCLSPQVKYLGEFLMLAATLFVNYKKGWTQLAAASDKVYQLLVHSRWFSSGIPASSTTKTGRRDIAEMLLNMALNTINQISQE
jgi:hypothetical protein